MTHDHDVTGEEPRVVVRDKRRIDPETGAVRPPADPADPIDPADPADPADQADLADPVDPADPAPAGAGAPAEPLGGGAGDAEEVEGVIEFPAEPEVDPAAEVKAQLDERTLDLKRLQAEYANYRKRVDRDREAVVASAKASVVTELLGVLDDVERANAHGDLTGAFKAVADKLTATLTRTGLEPFGHEGEPFDPAVHEAVQHATSTEVDGPTVTGVLRRGYRFGERVLRPAMVAVTDAETPSAAPGDGN